MEATKMLKMAGYDEDGLHHEVPLTGPFKVGDVVKLKSGGPDMTVIRLDLYSQFRLGYFAGDGKACEVSFPAEALVPTTTSVNNAD